jgi:hypothetical protein
MGDAPLNRRVGDRAALTRGEIHDRIAFLGTLTDRYPAASR